MAANPPDRTQVIGNITQFLKSANTPPRLDETPTRAADPMITTLRGLAEGPRSLPHLVKQTGIGPSELAPLLEKLEAMRMVKRQEEEGRFLFSLDAEGKAMLDIER